MLAKEQTLPRPQIETPLGDRDRQLGRGDHRLDVSRHVVRPLGRVGPSEILGDHIVEPRHDVPGYVRRGILGHGERGRGVPNHQMNESDSVFRKLGQGGLDLRGDRMDAPRPGLQCNLPSDQLTGGADPVPECSGAGDVFTGAGVDTDQFPLFDEERDLNLDSGLERGRLGPASGGRVTLESRLGLRDRQVDRAGNLNVGRALIDEEDIDFVVGSDPPHRLFGERCVEFDLIVSTAVHEDDCVAGFVEELHLLRLGSHRSELLACTEGLVEHRTVVDPPQLRPNESPSLAWLDVLELEDPEDRSVHLDMGSVLELIGRNHVASVSRTRPTPTCHCGNTGAMTDERPESEEILETPRLLEDLLRSNGPSGYEAEAASVWREAASFADLATDGLGSSIATIGGDGESPLVAVVGHIDEIGLVVTHIDDKGFIHFTNIGGWDPQILIGQRIVISGRNGSVEGVAGRKPIHLLDPEQRKQVVKLKDMHLDIGASDRDEAEKHVSVGDPAVIDTEPVRLLGNTLVSKSLDNRVGCYVALEALRRVNDDGGPPGRFAAVAAVQEEIGLFGSRTAAFTVRPDAAVAIDVTHATDAPGIDETQIGSHPFGSGPAIGRGSTLSPRVFELLRDAAEEEEIPYSVGASGNSTHTDADSLQISRSGIPTGLISVPVRYMHSPVEMLDLRDLENTVRLVAAFVRRLGPDTDLSR